MNELESFEIFNLPKQITEFVNHDVDTDVDSYMYLITCLQTGKWYAGIHKQRDSKDFYWNTSTDDDFRKQFASSDSNFKLEILMGGSYLDMKIAESEYLREHDAIKNPMSWNKSLGSWKSDTDIVFEISENVLCDEYRQTDRISKDDLIDIEFHQSREQEYDEQEVQSIVSLIQEQGGNTDNCHVCLLASKSGRPIKGIDGRHTQEAIKRSKNAVDSPYSLIPHNIWSKLSLKQLDELGHFLNPRPKIRKTPTKVDDKVALYMREWKRRNNLDLGASDIINLGEKKNLVRANFSKSEIERIVKKVREHINEHRGKNTYGPIKNWESPESNEYIQDKIDRFNNDKNNITNGRYMVGAFSAKVPVLHRWFSNDVPDDVKVLRVLFYHKNYQSIRNWTKTRTELENAHRKLQSPVKLVFEVLPLSD